MASPFLSRLAAGRDTLTPRRLGATTFPHRSQSGGQPIVVMLAFTDPIGCRRAVLKLYINWLGWDDEAGREPYADQGSHERRSVPRSYQTMSRPTLRRTDIVVIDAVSIQQGPRCGGSRGR